MSRGNYRQDLFRDPKTARVFEESLFEVCERCGWVIYAYVIMSNHYHLALKTPEPNLVAGMQWLQGSFATRFNRFRGESGHVFQGRYKALVVEAERPLLGLVDYIHLNPVRAGLCALADLKSYLLSSYPKYWKRNPPNALDRGGVLSLLGASDSVGGMRQYQRHLELNEAKDPAKRELLFKQYCRGWFVGSDQARRSLAKELIHEHGVVDWEGADYASLKEESWEMIVSEALARLGKDDDAIASERKGVAWKVEIARKLRKETTASNVWIARRLKMGHPNRVSMVIRADVRI
jgi:REP element-mobilizing transposase RayT